MRTFHINIRHGPDGNNFFVELKYRNRLRYYTKKNINSDDAGFPEDNFNSVREAVAFVARHLPEKYKDAKVRYRQSGGWNWGTNLINNP